MIDQPNPASAIEDRNPTPSEAAEILVETVELLSRIQGLSEVIELVKTAARRLSGADGASFVLRDGDLCHYVDEDAIGPLWKGKRFPMDICISGWAMRNRQPVLIPDIQVDSRIPQEAYRATFVKSLVMAPIRSRDPMGAIGIYWRQTHRPSAESVKWLQSLADSTALAMEHLESHQEIAEARFHSNLIRQQNEELKRDAAVKDVQGVLKMCFITKKVEVSGSWLSLEAFLEQRLGLHVSHGLSPEALRALEDAQDCPPRVQPSIG